MDTRFWGPSGWKMLHTITFEYNPKNSNAMRAFLETLPFILPCKFCRASLTEYYRQHPYEPHLHSRNSLAKWMYIIHNCVNDKLRKQGFNPTKDPSFTDVSKMYNIWLKEPWEQRLTTFWDFLFSIAYNHPKETTKESKPMPDCPSDILKCRDACEKNRWNVLDEETRTLWFNRFWTLFPATLPKDMYQAWRDAELINPPILDCRRSTVAWLWRMRCQIDSDYHDPYRAVCKKIASYSSSCSSSTRARTCRKTRKAVH